MKKNNRAIALIGFMGTGKTTIGSLLAKKTGFLFVDTDATIEKKEGRKISEIFAKDGETYFRKLETETLQAVLTKDKQIISTGGGIILKAENRQLLQNHSYLICLRASPEVIYQRTKEDKNRPLLMGVDPKKQIEALLSKRQAAYRIADLTIDTDHLEPEMICQKILRHYHKLE